MSDFGDNDETDVRLEERATHYVLPFLLNRDSCRYRPVTEDCTYEPRSALSRYFLAMLRIGLISDTHDLLRPAASAFLSGCDHIIHGGDVGNEDILQRLAAIAPLTVVRGNNDKGAWAERLPKIELIRLGEVYLYVLHNLAELDIDPQAAGVGVVISGHSHQPCSEERDGVLYINPGSAGPRRFKLPITAAELFIDGFTVKSRIVELNGDA